MNTSSLHGPRSTLIWNTSLSGWRSARTMAALLSVQPTDGGPERTLALPFVQVWTYSWSPDGARS
jgi:hypothetical protein